MNPEDQRTSVWCWECHQRRQNPDINITDHIVYVELQIVPKCGHIQTLNLLKGAKP